MIKYRLIFLFYFCAQLAICQTGRQGMRDIFLSLPDSFFVQPGLRNFSKIDSFPLRERKWLVDSGAVEGIKSKSSHYSRLLKNETNQVIVIDNGSGSTTLKLWNVSPTKKLLCILTTIADFAEPRQKLNFYWVENGKYNAAKDLAPKCLALLKFFDEKDLIKNKIGKQETTCILHYQCSLESDFLEISPKSFQFEADYATDERLVKLAGSFKREKVSYKWEKDKFVMAVQKNN